MSTSPSPGIRAVGLASFMLASFMLASAGGALAAAAPYSAEATPGPDTDLDPSNYAVAWLRVEADRVGPQLLLGATPRLGPLDLALDVVVSGVYPGAVDPSQSSAFNAALGDDTRAPTARLELGLAFSSGGLFVLPKLGIGYDFERERVAPLVPQAIVILQGGPAYLESWLQFFLYDLFEDGALDSFQTRNTLLVAVAEPVSVGAELDATIAIGNAGGDALRSLPFGAVANLQIVPEFTLGLFIGYESQKAARNGANDWLAGRLTASVLWR